MGDMFRQPKSVQGDQFWQGTNFFVTAIWQFHTTMVKYMENRILTSDFRFLHSLTDSLQSEYVANPFSVFATPSACTEKAN